MTTILYYHAVRTPIAPREQATSAALHSNGPHGSSIVLNRETEWSRPSAATKSGDPTKDLPLRGLDAAATYEVTDLDAGVPNNISGRDLMQKGLHVEVPAEPGAAIIVYRKVR